MYLTCGRKVVEHGPITTVADLDRGEVDGVEVDVVLAHELIQANVLLVEPPLLPLWSVVGCDTWVPYACIELGRNKSASQAARGDPASYPNICRDVSAIRERGACWTYKELCSPCLHVVCRRRGARGRPMSDLV